MVLTVAAAACRDSTALDTLGTQYELTSYAGATLPYTWRVISTVRLDGTSQNCNDEITGGSLLFGDDGGVTVLVERDVICDGQPDLRSFDSALGSYSVSGSRHDITLEGSLADLPGTGPYAVSAQIAGDLILVSQTVSHTPGGAVTDRTPKTFRLVN